MSKSLMVLIAGPYRSGTNDDPERMRENLNRLEAVALELWNRGHLPIIGEWLALPLIRAAGSRRVGDEVWDVYGYPVADRIIDRCDAVLRMPGASKGADGDVRRANELGIPVFNSLNELPAGSPREARDSRI